MAKNSTLPAERRAQLLESACNLLEDSCPPLRTVATELGISPNTLRHLRRTDPEFREELERAAFEGSTALLDEMRETPYLEPDPRRARVKIDALRSYLELRWPDRFGKRLDVTVRTIDLGDAIAKARQRAGITIESVAYEHVATDGQSVDALEDMLS